MCTVHSCDSGMHRTDGRGTVLAYNGLRGHHRVLCPICGTLRMRHVSLTASEQRVAFAAVRTFGSERERAACDTLEALGSFPVERVQPNIARALSHLNAPGDLHPDTPVFMSIANKLALARRSDGEADERWSMDEGTALP